MNPISDTMLVGKAALGDRRAFDALVSRHALPLRRYLLRLTGDPPLADDLAQETFIKAYCRIGTFGGLAGFRTWLFRIGYNAFCSYRRGEHEAGELDDSLPADETADPDTVHDVQAALARLRTVERSALLLLLQGGLPGGESGGHHAPARGYGEVAPETGTRQTGNILETKRI